MVTDKVRKDVTRRVHICDESNRGNTEIHEVFFSKRKTLGEKEGKKARAKGGDKGRSG